MFLIQATSVVLCFISICSAQRVQNPQYITQGRYTTVQRAVPCCTPNQWEGTAAEEKALQKEPTNLTLQQHSAKLKMSRVSYDYTNRRFAASTLAIAIQDHSMYYITSSLIVHNTTAYYIDWRQGSCKRFKMSADREFCVPKNARLVASPVFGLGKLKSNSFEGADTSSYGEVAYAITVTEDSCVPILDQAFGKTRDGEFTAQHVYYDITAGIRDQKVFDVPAVCRKASPSGKVPKEMPDQLKALSARFW